MADNLDPDYDPADDEGDDSSEAKARRAAYARRQASNEKRDSKVAELEAELAAYKRKEALDKARAEIKATGPLDAYLKKVYDGDPTADAIKAAVAKDPDFKDLIAFEADGRDEAAAIQGKAAAAVKGAAPVGSRPATSNAAPGMPRVEAHYAATGSAAKST